MSSAPHGVLTTSQKEKRFGTAKGGMMYDLTHSHLDRLPGNATVIGAALENDQVPKAEARTITVIDTSRPRAPVIGEIALTGKEKPGQAPAAIPEAVSAEPVRLPPPPVAARPPTPPVMVPAYIPPPAPVMVEPQGPTDEQYATYKQNVADELADLIQDTRSPEMPQERSVFVPAFTQIPQAQPRQVVYAQQDLAGILGLKFLQPDLAPGKPRRKVTYELPVGSFTARYHDVILGDQMLALVIDARDEDCDKFVPRKTVGEDAPIALSIEDEHKRPVHLHAFNFGTSFVFGCFQILVLMLTPPDFVKDDSSGPPRAENGDEGLDPMAFVYRGNLPPPPQG